MCMYVCIYLYIHICIKKVVFDSEHPHCLDVDVALASISDEARRANNKTNDSNTANNLILYIILHCAILYYTVIYYNMI